MAVVKNLNINFKGMQIIHNNKSSIIRCDGTNCYKIIKNYKLKNQIFERLEALMDERDLFDEHFIIPDELYKINRKYGYKSSFLPNSFVLANYVSSNMFYIGYNVTLLLKYFHEMGFAFGDFHFYNILIGENDEPYLFDFDNIIPSGFTGLFLTLSFSQMCDKHDILKDKHYIINKETDKICFYLALLELYFGKMFICITKQEILKEAKKNPVIEDIYILIYKCIKKKSFENIPYFDDLVNNNGYSLNLH